MTNRHHLTLIAALLLVLILAARPSAFAARKQAHAAAIDETRRTRPLATNPPTLQVTPTRIAVNQVANSQVVRSLTITNTGDTTLQWNIFEGGNPYGLAAGSNWSENFDSYPAGTNMDGVAGWEPWEDNIYLTAFTTNFRWESPYNSLHMVNNSMVHEFDRQDGIWIFRTAQYVDDYSGNSGAGNALVLFNTYNVNGPYNISARVRFSLATDTVISDFDGASLPLITDEWVQIRVIIDLNEDMQTFYYNDQLLYQKSWSSGFLEPGPTTFAAINLDNASSIGNIYYDSMSLTEVCGALAPLDWVAATPTGGATPPRSSSVVNVTFDTTGISSGIHEGTLCLQSNDPDAPLIPIILSTRIIRGAAEHQLFLPALVKN